VLHNVRVISGLAEKRLAAQECLLQALSM